MGKLTLVTPPPTEAGDPEFWLSEPELLEDGEGDWGFEIYGSGKVFIAGFVYPEAGFARAAAKAMRSVLQDVVFIDTVDEE
jgi:hypothetical protein